MALPRNSRLARGSRHLASRFGRLLAASRARRSAVRFAAAAVDAFLARAERSSGVIVSRLRLPPILPPLLPISRMISRNSVFVFLSIHFILRRFRRKLQFGAKKITHR